MDEYLDKLSIEQLRRLRKILFRVDALIHKNAIWDGLFNELELLIDRTILSRIKISEK